MSQVIHKLPFEEYLAIPAMSASALKRLAKSPRHFAAHVAEESPALSFGTLAHTAILEPDRLERFAVLPETRTNGDGKTVKFVRSGAAWEAFQAENAGAEGIVTATESAAAAAISQAVRDNAAAVQALRGEHEVTLLWQHPVFGACKARLDVLGSDGITDLKTAADISPWGFSRAARRYGYHIQAEWYLQGAAACGAIRGAKDFRFVAIESKAPYDSAAYVCDDAFLAAGRAAITQLAGIYRHCTETGQWPGAWPGEQLLEWQSFDDEIILEE